MHICFILICSKAKTYCNYHYSYTHRIQGVGKATGFIGHLQQNDRYLLITNHHVVQQHKHDPKKIKIIFKHGELMGSELFANDRWFTDNGTNLQDKVSYNCD